MALTNTREELDPWIQPIAGAEGLDAAADALRDRAGRLAESGVGSFLRGEWLGHTLHPLMTDLPIGCWTSAALVDVVGGRDGRVAARRLIGLGTLLALPTAATGMVELATIDEDDDESRRIAAVHAGANSFALLAYARSWWLRRRGRQVRGVLWSVVGAVAASGSGHLGGHLAFVRGIGDGGRRGPGHGGPATEPGDAGQGDTEQSDTERGDTDRGAAATWDDAIVGWDEAAGIVQVTPENLRTMVDEGLVELVEANPPTFRRADLEAVRLLGG